MIQVTIKRFGENWYGAAGPVRKILSLSDCNDVRKGKDAKGEWTKRFKDETFALAFAAAFESAGCVVDIEEVDDGP